MSWNNAFPLISTPSVALVLFTETDKCLHVCTCVCARARRVSAMYVWPQSFHKGVKFNVFISYEFCLHKMVCYCYRFILTKYQNLPSLLLNFVWGRLFYIEKIVAYSLLTNIFNQNYKVCIQCLFFFSTVEIFSNKIRENVKQMRKLYLILYFKLLMMYNFCLELKMTKSKIMNILKMFNNNPYLLCYC